SDRRYSDLAIATVELWLVAAAFFAGIGRILLGHLLLRGCSNSWDTSSSSWNAPNSSWWSASWRTAMPGECGRNLQQIVWYRDISIGVVDFPFICRRLQH